MKYDAFLFLRKRVFFLIRTPVSVAPSYPQVSQAREQNSRKSKSAPSLEGVVLGSGPTHAEDP